MIKKDCFAPAWIDALSERYNYRDKNLIEKVIHAFSLLEMLSSNGCPMIWKGGSSLMLILGEGASRLSIDIDTSPSTSAVDIRSDYVAKHGAPNAAAPKIFFRYYLVNTATGEKSGTMLAECKWTAGE